MRLTYFRPVELDAALEVLGRGDETCVIAGGTDVYPAMRRGRRPGAFLDVTRVAGLSTISRQEDHLRIGAAVTWSDIIAADLPPAFDALKQAAREVGSIQIQNAGTIAGNLCNASPAADGVPPLLALGARVELVSAERGCRVMDLSDFILDVRRTALRHDELVVAILVPDPPAGMTSAFEKLGSRKYLVISISMVAVNLVMNAAGRIAGARVAVGACSAVAQRLPGLEADMEGTRPEDVFVSEGHLRPLTPIDDVRGTAVYRMDAAGEQIRRAVRRAAAR